MDDGAKGSRHSHSGRTKGVGVYDSAEDALKELFGAFNYWSSQVTATSVQMCYAVIGANWVVFTSVGNIRSEERRVGKECRSRWSPYH